MIRRILDIEQLRNLLRYDPDSGKLYWLPRQPTMFPNEGAWRSWMTRYCGKEAFTSKTDKGYFHGTILGQNYAAHRVAFAIHYGYWPDADLDHADRERTNNKIENLRIATTSQNMSNRTKAINRSSKFRGVHWCNRDKSWIAKITKNRKIRHLGNFRDEANAALAYDNAAKEIHKEFASLNFPADT